MTWSRAISSDAHRSSLPDYPDQVRRQANAGRWAAFTVIAWMFVPLFTGQIYVCDDLLNYHLPIRQFYADCLQRGNSFDWMPSLFNGFFLTGSGQAGTYHPWHWMLYRFLPLQTAFNLEILSSYPFMLLGMKLLLQRQLERSDAAWLGAIVFAFSGFCTLHFLHPNAIAVVSHIPWLVLAHLIVLQPKTASRLVLTTAEVGIALLTASQLLLGYPQYVWFSLLAECIFCLGFCSFNKRGIRALALIAILKLLGLGAGAAQILPSMDALAQSDRTLMPAEYFFEHPLTAPDMLQWFNPFLTKSRVFGVNTHELGVYCGAIPLLLSIVAISRIRRPSAERRLIQVALALGLVGLWLAFGKTGGLYTLQTWLPMIGKFRWPSRIVVLLHFVVAILTAAGYVQLTSTSRLKNSLTVAVLAVPLLSILASIMIQQFYPKELVASWTLLVIGPILFCLAAVMVRDLSQGRFSVAFMLFVAGDLAAYGFTYEAMNNTRTFGQIIEGLQPPPGSPDEGRIIAETHLSSTNVGFGGNELLLAGWFQVDGYEGLLPETHLLNENLSLDGLRISGVKWIVNSGLHASIEGLLPTKDDGWLEVPNPLPRARLTSRTVTIQNSHEAVSQLRADGPVIVDRSVAVHAGSEIEHDSAQIVLDRPGEILVEVVAESSRLLVLAERFSPDWVATIDGIDAPIIRAEVDFMAFVVPEGNHAIRFSFEAASVANGRMISLGVFLVLLVVFFVRVRLPDPDVRSCENITDTPASNR